MPNDNDHRTVFDAVATEDIRSGDHVQMVVDPHTGRSTVRRASLVCAWCPVYAYPDPEHHPNGQPNHVPASP
jgi:hypothetical protein